MAKFLLVHGSCHGAWCWRDVLPALQARGHEAVAIDLPSHGSDATEVSEVTLDAYARAILDHIDDPVILVGHSMAGYPITRAADMSPEKIAKLVYLCAYVPVDGQSLADMRRAGPEAPIMEAITVSDDRRTFSAIPEKAQETFYHDCPQEAVDYAIPRLCPQPIRPQETAFKPGASRQVESHYIICDDDRVIPPVYQMMMSAHFPRDRVANLRTSHSPFFAAPEALADHLSRIAGST